MSPAMTEKGKEESCKVYQKGVQHLVEKGISRVPEKYILPIQERPNLRDEEKISTREKLKLPMIDFAELQGPNKAQVLKSLANACEQDGFFQVVNHGIPMDVINNMIELSTSFFELPFEERAKYMSSDMRSPVRCGTSFNHPHNGSGNATFLVQHEDPISEVVIPGETPSASSFEDLNLSPELLMGLHVEMKFQKPSKIQAICLPMILTPPYKDLIAEADDGSGKTTCLVLGMLSRVDSNLKAPQALCICPTRELAIQNMEVLRKMGKHTGITSECAVPMDSSQSTKYISITKRAPVSAHVVVGTPGTIKNWMLAKKLAFNNVKMLVFDEADHILAEDGFKDDSLRINKYIVRSSRHCQVLLFSASFNQTVKNFVAKIVKDYNQLFVKKEELSLASEKQYKVFCPDESGKIQINERFLEPGEHLGQRITLGPTEPSASKLHKQLVDDGSTSVRRGYKVADRVNHNDVLEKQRTNVDENSNWEKKLAMVKKEPEDTLREVRKDNKRACPVEIEEIMKAHSTELEETKRVQSTKLEEARRAHSTELEETKRVHSTKLEEVRRAHSIELEETRRVYSTKLEEAGRAHSIELEEIRRVHSTKLEEARRAYSTELEEARRGMEELKKKYEVAKHMVGLRRGGHSW